MKKLKQILLISLMVLGITGCSCSDEKATCPSNEPDITEQEYPTINNGYKDLYSQTVKSVVMIRIQRKSNGEVKASGSGVVFKEEGTSAFILTNAHVIKELTNDFEVEVFFSDKSGFMSGESEIATVMGKDFHEDVAILEINKSSKYKVATMGDSNKISKGDFVYTIGSPYQKFNYTTSGTITNYNAKIDLDTSNSGVLTPVYAILFDATINSGNSGGALFNATGEVIGITTFKYQEMEGVYGALPINYFIKVANYLLINNRSYVRPNLNLTLLSVNEMGALREAYGIATSITTGVYIQNSLEENIASQSLITEINGISVKNVAEFQLKLLEYDVGATVTLTLVNRDGLGTRQVSVVLHS